VLFEPHQCEVVRIERNVRRFIRVVGDVFAQQCDNPGKREAFEFMRGFTSAPRRNF